MRRPIRYARYAASLLCAASAGSLLFSVRIAMMVFGDMPDDRLSAGRIAGRAFVSAYAISASAALIALVVTIATRIELKDRALSIALLVMALLELLWIAPAIVAHGTGWPGSFASLHATGGALHLVLVVLSLVLAWRLLGDAKDGTAA
jgi:hypothetical protein